MFSHILEMLGFRSCKDVWAENELLQRQVLAAETNTDLVRLEYSRVRGECQEWLVKYSDACLRIIELEGEVNQLLDDECQEIRYPTATYSETKKGNTHGS